MQLTLLKAQNFRNLLSLAIEPSPQLNFIYGPNGSGKTSILEAIYLLGLGRSFRSHIASRIIQYEAPQFTVFGIVQNEIPISIGIEKSRRSKIRFKLAQESIVSITELIKLLPVQLIHPDSYQLLTGSARTRREFLDWGVFHVEPSFFSIWKTYRQILKQRNAALQHGLPAEQVHVWNKSLVSAALELAKFREKYLQQFMPVFQETSAVLLSLQGLSVKYEAGWQTESDLTQLLIAAYSRDCYLGYTHLGPHRADLVLKIKDIPAADILSRGEQKLLVYSLRLAQGILLQKLTAKTCVYLLDDLAAELDRERRALVLNLLTHAKAQIFLTMIEKNAFEQFSFGLHKLFHVEQGMIQEERIGRRNLC